MADPFDELAEGVGNLIGILVAAALGLVAIAVAFHYLGILLRGLFSPPVIITVFLAGAAVVGLKQYNAFQRGKGESQRLYERALQVSVPILTTYEDPHEEITRRLAEYTGRTPPPLLAAIAHELYDLENFSFDRPPESSDLVAHAAYRDEVRAKMEALSAPGAHDELMHAIANALAVFQLNLPDADEGVFTIPAVELLEDVGEQVRNLLATVADDNVRARGFFAKLRPILNDNFYAVSEKYLSRAAVEQGKFLNPHDHPGPAQQIVEDYLHGTPFERLFALEVPFALPRQARFEHMHIVAPQGAGKSQCIQFLVAHDLEKVARDEASIFIMDSQGDLIRNISRLEFFRDHPEKLLLIEPDPEFPPALNIFDLGARTTPREKERAVNATLELLSYVFSNLLGAEMTIKQETLWRHAVRACLEIPGATILTLQELIASKDRGVYAPHLTRLDGQTRLFFETQFYDRQFDHTRQEVGWRLSFLLENATFRQMFASPQTAIDLSAALLSSKVVCISTDKDLLGEERTQIFGRFFIALLLQAARQRAALHRNQRQPLFCYIDEAQDYIANDPYITTLLDQARKQNVALILAHQRCGQLSNPVLDALMNVSVKFAHGSLDSRKLAPHLRTTPEFIEAQPKGRFAAFVRNVTPAAVSLAVPFGHLEGMERMSEEDWRIVQDGMRRTYCTSKPEEPIVRLHYSDLPWKLESDPKGAAASAAQNEVPSDDVNWRS